jgi:hypothetical protein
MVDLSVTDARSLSGLGLLVLLLFGACGEPIAEEHLADSALPEDSWKVWTEDCAQGTELESMVAKYWDEVESGRLDAPTFVRGAAEILDVCRSDGGGVIDLTDLEYLDDKASCGGGAGVCRCDKVLHIVRERLSFCSHTMALQTESLYRRLEGRRGRILAAFVTSGDVWCNVYEDGMNRWYDVFKGELGGLVAKGDSPYLCEPGDQVPATAIAFVALESIDHEGRSSSGAFASARAKVLELVEGEWPGSEISLHFYCPGKIVCPVGPNDELIIAATCIDGNCSFLELGCFSMVLGGGWREFDRRAVQRC